MYQIGDIIRKGTRYMKISRIETDRFIGKVTSGIYQVAKLRVSNQRGLDSWYIDSNIYLVKSADGKVIPEIEKIQKMSRKEQIIYLVNKYKDRILKDGFLNNNQHYDTMAQDLGISNSDLFMYLTHKLRLNQLSNKINEWEYHVYEGMDKKEREAKLKAKEDKENKESIFSVTDVWRLLAYYCKYYNVQEAKTALARFERLFYKKDWDRIKEMWTPLFYPDYNYLQSKMIVCKIKGLREGKTNVYDAELLDDGISGTMSKKQYLNRKCIVIASEEDKVRINYFINQGSEVKIVGRKEKPYRNKTSQILKITTMGAKRR